MGLTTISSIILKLYYYADLLRLLMNRPKILVWQHHS